VAFAGDGWRLGLALCRGSVGERIVYTYRCSFYLRLLCTSTLRRGLDVCKCFCFLPSSFVVACVGGERDLVVAGMCMVHGDGFLCRGFGTDGYVTVVFLCIGD
jgi:hypothetical protein